VLVIEPWSVMNKKKKVKEKGKELKKAGVYQKSERKNI
jgi:hypothetical protein